MPARPQRAHKRPNTSSTISATAWVAVAETGAESEGFFFGVEDFRLREVESIVGVEKFFEAVDVIVHDEVNSEGFGNNVYFYGHNEQILRLFFYTQSYEKYMRKSL